MVLHLSQASFDLKCEVEHFEDYLGPIFPNCLNALNTLKGVPITKCNDPKCSSYPKTG